jgi:hypothetical protein
VLAVAGFSLSFFIRSARGVLAVPRIVYVHGTFFLMWVTVLIVQAPLLGRGRLHWHQRPGRITAALAPAMVASGNILANDRYAYLRRGRMRPPRRALGGSGR